MNNWNQVANFSQTLRDLLAKVEGKHNEAYDDGTGLITIGVGFNLMDSSVRRKVLTRLITKGVRVI